jgi:hypothetical protein
MRVKFPSSSTFIQRTLLINIVRTSGMGEMYATADKEMNKLDS